MGNLAFALNVFSEPVLFGGPQGGFYFDFFYLVAFLVATIWMIWEGRLRKIPWVSWLLVLAISRLFFIIGTKVIAYSYEDWIAAFSKLEFPYTTEKVIIGGFVLGLAAFYGAIRLFKISTGSFDAMAIAVPVSIAIQRIGCFLLGCCFGTPTNIPWGVSYGFGSPPHFHQFKAGLIEATAISTVPIHPFQLYEALNGIFVAFFVFMIRKKVKSQGGLFLVSIGGWAFVRALIEFFRDPGAYAMGGEIWGGLKVMQWILLGTSLCSLVAFYVRERHWRSSPIPIFSNFPTQAAVWLVLMVTVCMTWILRNWLTGPELFAMNLMLFPALIISAFYLFRENTIPSFRWATLTFMVLPLFLMSQTLKEKSSSDSTRTKGYDFFNLGFSTGDYYTETIFQPSGPNTGCGSPDDYETFKNVYWNAGFGYGRTKIKDNEAFTYGANISMGQYGEEKISTGVTTERFLFSINPYVQYDVKWLGIGGGLHIGNLYWSRAPENFLDKSNPDTGTLSSPVYPQVYMRIGPEQILFVDGGLANTLPSPFPGMRAEIALGSGFGLPKGNKLRIGTSNFGEFIQAQVLISNNWQASAIYSWSKAQYFIGMSEEALNRQLFLNLQYRFNHKE